MFKVVRESEGSVRQIAKGKSASNLITKDISPSVSLATTEATDYYESETSEYDRIYYVLTGRMEINVDGEQTTLNPGDTCFISRSTDYEMRGTFKAIVVNQPAFGS